jgi:hypothetical protein
MRSERELSVRRAAKTRAPHPTGISAAESSAQSAYRPARARARQPPGQPSARRIVPRGTSPRRWRSTSRPLMQRLTSHSTDIRILSCSRCSTSLYIKRRPAVDAGREETAGRGQAVACCCAPAIWIIENTPPCASVITEKRPTFGMSVGCTQIVAPISAARVARSSQSATVT